jgi:hypothetical protein
MSLWVSNFYSFVTTPKGLLNPRKDRLGLYKENDMTNPGKLGKLRPRMTLLLSLGLIFGSVNGGGFPAGNFAASYLFLNQLNQSVALVQPLSRGGDASLATTDRGASPLLTEAFQRILDDPEAIRKLGLVTQDFKATWYLANPFELLPGKLQKAIRHRKTPFRSRRQVITWLTDIKAPRSWRKAIKQAFIETTPQNLWRASRGLAPLAKNGKHLKPIAIQSPTGELILRQGDIATDPKVIPPNSDVLLIIQAGNRRECILAKAADEGSGIRGRHIDIPVRLNPRLNPPLPHLRFPKEFGHPRVTVVLLGKLPRP